MTPRQRIFSDIRKVTFTARVTLLERVLRLWCVKCGGSKSDKEDTALRCTCHPATCMCTACMHPQATT